MERLTSNKKVSDMSMFELAHNSCYCKDGVARYRDFENDIDARDLARELVWSLADIELSRNNECFDEEIIENMQYDITKEPIGLIALFYRNLWAMADLRERLKEYEDLEEQGRLVKLPCKAGDTVYRIENGKITQTKITKYDIYADGSIWFSFSTSLSLPMSKFKTCIFLTQAEAEQKLKEMEV